MPLGFARLNTISKVLGSAAPTYAISESTTSVNEGSSVTFTITTANVADATTLYWSTQTMSGTINASDFTGGATTGSFTINSNSGSVVRTIASDATTEGSESFRLQIRTGSTSGDIVATSNTVTINDTSLSPTFAVSPAANNVNEGSSLQFNVTTTNVANGTTLFFTLTNSGDFATSSGSFTINSNAGNFSVTPTADNTTEGAETFQAQVRTGSTSGTIVVTSSAVTINDTSTAPKQLTYLGSFTSSNSGTLAYPSGIQSGDYIFLVKGNLASTNNGATGFTEFSGVNFSSTVITKIWYKVAAGTESGTNVPLTLDGTLRSLILVIRPNFTVTSITRASFNSEGTSSAPQNQTINVSGQSAPLMNIAVYQKSDSTTPTRGWSGGTPTELITPFADAGQTGGTFCKFLIYNEGSTPANATISMTDAGNNTLQSMIIKFNG